LTIAGSVATDTNSDSDLDLHSWCIPKKEIVFSHTIGVIKGFGWQGENFEQWQQHHILDKDALKGRGREYDIQIYIINNKNDAICSELIRLDERNYGWLRSSDTIRHIRRKMV
jgi:hypothetical protein